MNRFLRHIVPTTDGSKSAKIALGTCFPDPISLKNVLYESSVSMPTEVSVSNKPSGIIPCSMQYSSQQALPICTPAWPTCMEMISRILALDNKTIFQRKSFTLRTFWHLVLFHTLAFLYFCFSSNLTEEIKASTARHTLLFT